MRTARSDEGRRVLRNAISIGGFLLSPFTLMLMVRALGGDGYGRWWFTFVLLEAAGILGMLGVDLFVRREVPPLADDDAGNAELAAIVGSSLSVACVAGVGFAVVQIAIARPLAAAQHDPALVPFLTILAIQPLLWNIGGVLGAGLQSRNFLGALAVIRGLVFPIIGLAVYFVAWRRSLPVAATLAIMTGVSVLGVVATMVIYARHLPLRRTLLAALRPTRARRALGYSLRLLAPIVLFTIGGKLDLWMLGYYTTPVYVGLYAACLQMSSGIPNTRGLFDPVIQAQIGAFAHERHELGVSLRHLVRLCAFALAPVFVVTVAVGQPILGWLLGHDVALAGTPLLILTVVQLAGSIAISAWIVPMLFAGRALTVIAAVALAVKLALLIVLVPRYGASGAAIATGVGGLIAAYSQAWVGARLFKFWPFPSSLVPVLLLTLVVAAAGRIGFALASPRLAEVTAVMIVGAASVVALVGGLAWLLDASDWREVRRLVGRPELAAIRDA